MIWRTKIKMEDLPKGVSISYQSKIILMGSCFSSNIGKKLSYYKFDATINPLGITYNPYSILKHIKYFNKNNAINENDLFLTDKGYSHFDFHGDISFIEKELAYLTIKRSIDQCRNKLMDADFLFITYGTAFIFDHKSQGIVNNCHKVNALNFDKKLLDFDTLGKIVTQTIMLLKSLNKDLKIVFCLSPIRHTKNGIVKDRRSKSLLHAAIHSVLERHSNCFYFPSYEILMDDLRDYRFYEKDLIHPNDQAISYIWEHFIASFINEETKELLLNVQKINKQYSHRAINPFSEEHKLFKEKLRENIKDLVSKGLDYRTELAALESSDST